MSKLIAALAVQRESAMKDKSDKVDTNVFLDLSRQYKTKQMELSSKVEAGGGGQPTEKGTWHEYMSINYWYRCIKKGEQSKTDCMLVRVYFSRPLSGRTEKREKRSCSC